jgi:O-methyltransferase involved in polyketide biosynthesis
MVAARVGGLALQLVELLLLQRIFPGAELVLALGVANAFRLIGAVLGRRPARAAAGAAALAAGVCLAILRLRGGAPGAFEIYAVVGAARLALASAGRLGPIESGLAPGALVTHVLIAAGASPRTLAAVHLLGAAFGAALTWSHGVDPARIPPARRARVGLAAGAAAWLAGVGMAGAAEVGVGVVATVCVLPLFLAAGVAGANRLRRAAGEAGDLSVTALYTNGAWTWAGLPGADLLASREANATFDATNLVLAIGGAIVSAPSLRCSLVQRHVMIDHLLAQAGARHVLELAAGLSRRGVAVSADPDVTYTEVDRAPVIDRKRRLLERTPAGRAALARPNLRLVAADLADAPLAELVTAPAGAPLFVIAEGLLMYLDAAAQRALCARVRGLFDGRPGTFVFDLVPVGERPRAGRIGRVLGWALGRATGGAGFADDARTRDDIAADLRGLGFAVELVEPRDVAGAWNLPHAGVRTQQLVYVCRTPPGPR